MTSRDRGSRLISFAFALGAYGVGLGFSTLEQRPALIPALLLPPPLVMAVEGASCPLPVAQQLKAVKAFQAMMPVLPPPSLLQLPRWARH